MKTILILITATLTGCTLTKTAKVGPLSVDRTYPTFVAMPEGIALTNLLKDVESDRIKGLFAYYNDLAGVPHFLGDLGLEVTGFRGTLSPIVTTNLHFYVATSVDASGNFSIIGPLLSGGASAGASNVLEITIKGDLLPISPKYTLTVDPTWVVLPAGYITELLWAEQINIDQFEAREAGAHGQWTNGTVDVGGKIQGEKLIKIASHFQHALFGRYEVLLDQHKPRRESQRIKLSPQQPGKAYFTHGNEGRKEPVSIVKWEEPNVTINYIGHDYTIRRGAWVNVGLWTAIRFKDMDKARGEIEIEYIEFTDPNVTSGVSMRFKEFSPIPPHLAGKLGRTFNVSGHEVIVRDLDQRPVVADSYGDSGSTITAQLDLSTTPQSKGLAFVVGNRQANKNKLLVVDENLTRSIEWEFTPNCPFENARNTFTCSALNLVDTKKGRHFVIAFNDEYFPSVLVLVDESGKEQGRLWHPGHIYRIETLGDRIFCWGKINATFPETALANHTNDPVTFWPPVVWSISADEIHDHALMGPIPDRLLDPFMATKSEQFTLAKFQWYYMFDHRTREYSGFSLDVKPIEKQVLFTSNERWQYRFDVDGHVLDRAPIEGATAGPWKPQMLFPKDETGEFTRWSVTTKH
jgi:hypothetical protein